MVSARMTYTFGTGRGHEKPRLSKNGDYLQKEVQISRSFAQPIIGGRSMVRDLVSVNSQ